MLATRASAGAGIGSSVSAGNPVLASCLRSGSVSGAGSARFATGGSAGIADSCRDSTGSAAWADAMGAEGWVRSGARFQYQATNAALKATMTTIDSMTGALGAGRARSGCSRTTVLRRTARMSSAGIVARSDGRSLFQSGTVDLNVVAAVRMPENRPAQPRQYLARSTLGVWQDSQNLVMSVAASLTDYQTGINAETTAHAATAESVCLLVARGSGTRQAASQSS